MKIKIILSILIISLAIGCLEQQPKYIPINTPIPEPEDTTYITNNTSVVTTNAIPNVTETKSESTFQSLVINTSDNKTVEVIQTILKATNKNITEHISYINVLSKQDLYTTCGMESFRWFKGQELVGCINFSYSDSNKLLYADISIADHRTYYYDELCDSFDFTLYKSIGRVVYAYNLDGKGIYGDRFSEIYAGIRISNKKTSGCIDYSNIIKNLALKYGYVYNPYYKIEYSPTDISVLLRETNPTISKIENKINLIEPLVPKKGIECDKLYDNELEHVKCVKEYNNLTKEYIDLSENYRLLVIDALKHQYIGFEQ